MKLIFLGDSFTEGTGIDFEYGIKINLFPDDDSLYFSNRKQLFYYPDVNNFRKNNVWTKLLCNELNVIEENFALGASGLDSVFLQLIESEKKNIDNKRYYIICLPFLNSGRFIIKNELSDNQDIFNIFNRVVLNNSLSDDDLLFYKNNFNENYFKLIYLQSLISIINYLKNKKIDFLILPTWHNTIEQHFFSDVFSDDFKNKKKYFFVKKSNYQKNDYFYKFFKKFVFNEIKDQMDFNIDISKIKKLPCGHPNIESQKIIKNMCK
jgi:hypothetical protein